MPVLPRTRIDKIEWFEARLDDWLAEPAAIGLTAQQVTELAGRVAAARAAFDAAQIARNQAVSATAGFHAASAAMEGPGRDLIATIKAFAEASGDAGVYQAARVPPPAAPTPAGPPDPPTGVAAEITSDGAVLIRWRGSLAHRTFFEVLRRLDGEETWTALAAIGAKSYLDDAVPVGTTGVQYRVRARRGADASAASAAITVRLGVERQTGTSGLGLAA